MPATTRNEPRDTDATVAGLEARLAAALERQAATAEILGAIASSSGDAEQSLHRIAEITGRLFDASSVSVMVADGEKWGLTIRVGAGSERINAAIPVAHVTISAQFMPGAVYLENRQVHVPDIDDPAAIARWPGVTPARAAGTRTLVGTPLRREGRAIGTLIVHRDRLAPFAPDELALLQAFADQAAIAVENARLVDEVEAKARELTDSLQFQTATSEVLQVISKSPGALEPVFSAVLQNATRICDAGFGTLLRFDGSAFHFAADVGTPAALADYMRRPGPFQGLPGGMIDRILKTRSVQHTPDYAADAAPGLAARLGGARSTVGVPILRDDVLIGAIVVYRQEVRPFSDHEIELVQSFAAQAAIAIDNARLFNETREALERQNATAEILRTIASTPGDARRSLQQIAETSARLFGAPSVSIQLAHDGEFTQEYRVGDIAQRVGTAYPRSIIRVGGRNLPGTVVAEDRQIHIPDLDHLDPSMSDFPGLPHARAGGARTVCGTPLRREGKSIGVLIIFRNRLLPFTDDELALQQTFADQAAIAVENARLINETREALERQTATADILKVIASSPSDVQPVFEAIAERANRLIGGLSTAVMRVVGDQIHLVAFTAMGEARDQVLKAQYPRPVSDVTGADRLRQGETVQITDTEADPRVPGRLRDLARLRGYRSILSTPMMLDEGLIGITMVTRREPGPFDPRHCELLKTFADQAVIAIQNARLIKETRDALGRQTATADILKVIASSPTDLQPVFLAIAESARELTGAVYSSVARLENGLVKIVANVGWDDDALAAMNRSYPRPAGRDNPLAVAIIDGEVQNVADILASDANYTRGLQAISGYRSMLVVPVMREHSPVGALCVFSRQVGVFQQSHVDLLKTFASQAVIAIENTRLFNETQEALEQQTATADILKVIASSPSDVQPVFEAIAERSQRLVDALSTTVFRLVDGIMHLKAFTTTTPEADAELESLFPAPLSDFSWGDAIRRSEIHRVVDTENEVPSMQKLARLRGFRSMLFVPLLRDGEPIGVIAVTRVEPGPFPENYVQLLRTFADQAVIAIQNVQLFDEVQARTGDLSEALQQQTATADVLKVISRSAFDLDVVMNTLTSSASRLCGADGCGLYLADGDRLVCRGMDDAGDPERAAFLRRTSIPIDETSGIGRAMLHGAVTNIGDFENDPGARLQTFQQMLGFKAILIVPLMREGRAIGAFALVRNQIGTFTQRQVELVQTFADQAVIAVENARLFDEVQARTRDLSEALQQQTATADVLKVISRSAFDLQTVLETLIRSAVELSGARRGSIFLRDGDEFRFRAATQAELHPEWIRFLKDAPQKAGRHSAIARAISGAQTVCVPDVLADPEIRMPATLAGIRAVLAVPLLRDGKVEGIMALSRETPGPFNPRQIELVETFADQAVIAIENARLFDEVQARTRELSQSLDELRTAQDRLVQTEKLASLGQLTAGIAHEIKNPLNFVNNFAALSGELIDELLEVLQSAPLDATARGDVDQLTHMLKGNLDKVVQHGRRADSIVKNMLLHSREGTGERRSADVNALVEESLNLAYHGARAEKSGFNVTLRRDLAPDAGAIELYPQEITRVLLNLITNGFYATAKRKAEAGDGFEPTLSAATRDLGHSIEIRIRDNGTGIPPHVREKIFNPFFTTKPAGEGTGLGLSMSHDIIVKQHGGTIAVETEPGQFTEFIVTLPRAGVAQPKLEG